MPFFTFLYQNNQKLDGFYKEFTSEIKTVVESEFGNIMNSFISIVNKTFQITTLFGLTSHNSILIYPTENKDEGWLVKVSFNCEQKVQIEYKLPENKSPWKYALIKGQTDNIQEARDFLIIAMEESEGWLDNKELSKLYNKLKNRKTDNPKFNLWLEFEHVDFGDWSPENEFCNIQVNLEDGRSYGLNVWTYNYLQTSINENKKEGNNLNGLYQKPPDLFVKELTRECIEKSIQDLLNFGDLEKVLNPSIF